MTTRKTEVTPVDGTPLKRMFWSIISDYDLQTGLCELIDNAIDLWTSSDRNKPLTISVSLDVDRQLISVYDNSGGVPKQDLRLLIAPGGSRNDPNAEIIGIFGVGGKRAGIALGEKVEIKTRFKKEGSFQLDITPEWLLSPDWELAAYRIPDIPPGTTQVEVSHLRKPFPEQAIKGLSAHFGETYAWFLKQGCTIKVNGKSVTSHNFDRWAFPPGFAPQSGSFSIDLGQEGTLGVDITGGLIRDRNPEEENYGVYVYCNHRLVIKELKTRDVGYFVTSEAGVPHPDASLCRVIVRLQGPAKLMPWNSSKSGINVGHAVFQQIRPPLIRLVSHYSSLSRRLKNNWDDSVFAHQTGTIGSLPSAEILTGRRLNLPPLPRVNKPHIEDLKARNKTQLKNKPWTLGLVEAIAAVGVISRQRLDTRNRIALILLDSNFEIALKEFVVHRSDLFPPKQFDDAKIRELFQKRHEVIKAVSDQVRIPAVLLDKIRHYYVLRNKLIHERATVEITNTDVANYQATIEKILSKLFDLKFPRHEEP